ncbi:MAG TPA: hypothetical protein VFE34_19210 [Dongiaceae bacterium]|jgi:hypothetical protein|nr:hypothetical protein [Dongiaceae bacterium]
MSRLPILSAALLSAGGLMWDGMWSSAAAQAYSGQSNEVVVNYDVLNTLPGQPMPYGGASAGGAKAGTQPKSQFLPGGYNPGAYGVSTTLPPYTPYGQVPPAGVQTTAPVAPGLAQGTAPGLGAPPTGEPSSVLTTLGPDGRPITPIKLRKPGSGTQNAQKPKKNEYAAPVQKPQAAEPAPDAADAAAPSDTQAAAATPPAAPEQMPAQVPMPEPAPAAPPPAATAETPPAAPAVETPAPPAEAAMPAQEQPAQEQPAQEQPAQQPAAQEQPAAEKPAEPAAEQQAATTPPPPAEGEAAKTEETEQKPAEEATAETPPEPDNSQPAPPIPQGGIRIVFPTDLNEVPSEANAALDDLASQMQADENMRIQIMCYASGTEDTESKARRKSLARCINIRQYLFKKDVRTTRMDVRALGLKSEGQPADRVDIVPANS